MKKRLGLVLGLSTVLFSLFAFAQPGGCDRACLDNVLNDYLEALVANKPAQAPLATTYRHTENSIVEPLGEGMWRSVTGLGAVQRHYIDEETSNIVYYGIMDEDGVRAIVSLRLHIENELVDEAEWFIGREDDRGSDGVIGNTLWDADNLTNVNPPLIREVPVVAEKN